MTKEAGFAQTYFSKLSVVLGQLDTASVDAACDLIYDAWQAGRQVITLGNGGSSLTALHFIADWNKSVFLKNNKPFYGRTLIDNLGLLMAYSNDMSFQDVFVEQLKNVLKPGDLVIAISGSGNSENVIRAVQYANEHGAKTLALTGYDGGRLKKIAQTNFWVPVNDMQVTEDIHSMFGHLVMQKFCGIR